MQPSHLKRRFRRFYWRHVRRYAYEICHECGRPVARCSPTWWRADDALWLKVVGQSEGLLCIPCFTHKAEGKGLLIYWAPVVERICNGCREPLEPFGFDHHHGVPVYRCGCCAPLPEVPRVP